MDEGASRDEVLKVLADPTRWRIVTLFGEDGELSCEALQDVLPLSKPTISYHTKVLARAGLIDAHRRGRHVSYTLRGEALRGVVHDIATLAPGWRGAEPVALPTW